MKISFKQIKELLTEKIKVHQNKSIDIFFNQYKGHTLQDKLDRANITKKEFKQSLNKVTKTIKTDKLDSGRYAFVFDKYKLPTEYDKENKKLFILTILTKDMKIKKDDEKVMIESVNYQIIYI